MPVLALGACRRHDLPVAYDLARRAMVADHEAPWDLFLLGSPQAEMFFAKGLRQVASPDGEAWAAASPVARLVFVWERQRPRTALLEVEPAAPQTKMEVRLNKASLGRFELAQERRRYRFEIPEGVQRAGRNRMRIIFNDATESKERGAEPPASAARLYSLIVAPADSPGLTVDATAGSLFSARRAEVVQVGPSVLRFALWRPGEAELRTWPRLRSASQAAARITAMEEGGAEQELWSRVLSPGVPTGEVRLPLPGTAGAPLLIGFHVDPGAQGGAAVAWSTPRVHGRGGTGPFDSAPPPEREDRRAEGLRRTLAGTSVVLVVLDAAGASHFGCYGYARRTTPEIDRIAAEGVVFERAYTPAVFTYAAMGALWTSRQPDEGAEWLRGGRLPADRLTLAELLAANGVHTAAFVANPSAGQAFGLARGFTEFQSLYRAPWADGLAGADVFRRALHPWLAEAHGRRFFAYAHFREPHYPYDPPPPFRTLFGQAGALPGEASPGLEWMTALTRGDVPLTPEQRESLVRLYDGNLAYADREVGALRRALEKAGLWDKILLIVAADHGEEFLEHGRVGHNNQVYEESVRIPLIVRFPAGGPTRVRVRELVSLLDIAPTVADVFGLKGRHGSERAFRGRSLLPVALGAPGSPALMARTAPAARTYALIGPTLKYIFDGSSGGEQLYDLASDPGERVDLAPNRRVSTAAFRQALLHWLLELRAARATPVEPSRIDDSERESLRALGYLE